MKTIDYTNISLGMESSPSFNKQLQDGVTDRMGALMKALTNGSNQIVIVHGCVMTVVGTDYTQTAGAVFYQGDFYTVDAFSGSHATQIPVYVADSVYDRQVWYGDLVRRDTFFTKKLKLQMAASGSGLANYNAAVRLEDKLVEFIDLAGTLSAYAPLASPALTGNPTVPTQLQTDNSTRAANTAFVKAAIAALVNSSPSTLDTLNELAAALGNDPNFATTIATSIGQKVSKVGDAMTGNLTVPNGTAAGHAVNKGQLDAEASARGSADTAMASDISSINTRLASVKTVILDVGVWNMDTTGSILVPHGIAGLQDKQHWIKITLRADDDAGLVAKQTCDFPDWVISIEDPSVIVLTRSDGSGFDGVNFDKTSGGYNRGWIKIDYIP